MNAKDRVLLAELLSVVVDMLDQPGDSDLVGRVRAWCDVAAGKVKPGDQLYYTCTEILARQARPMPEDMRRMEAVRLAGQNGEVTSRDLCERCNVSQETARLDLQNLAASGLLRAAGEQRGRCYRLATQQAGG
jgi:hypothetical protein